MRAPGAQANAQIFVGRSPFVRHSHENLPALFWAVGTLSHRDRTLPARPIVLTHPERIHAWRNDRCNMYSSSAYSPQRPSWRSRRAPICANGLSTTDTPAHAPTMTTTHGADTEARLLWRLA